MAADMDIDMDLDIELEPDSIVVDNYQPKPIDVQQQDQPVLPPPETAERCPEKIHLRGLANLTSGDIESFLATYEAHAALERIQWIDDASANLVFPTAEDAQSAFQSICQNPELISPASLMQLHVTKPLPHKENITLQARVAVATDRKQPGARERSRFYLLNPEYDRGEERDGSRGRGRGVNRYRDRSGHPRDQYTYAQGRARRTVSPDFDGSLYDDDLDSRAQRALRGSNEEISIADMETAAVRSRRRGRQVELFPGSGRGQSSSRLRYRSASPARESRPRPRSSGVEENKSQARALRAKLGSSMIKPLELFPQKLEQRSDHNGAAEAADLFTSKMIMSRSGGQRLPSGNGSSEKPAGGDTLRIKGMAAQSQSQPAQGRELFPKAGVKSNATRELFSNRP